METLFLDCGEEHTFFYLINEERKTIKKSPIFKGDKKEVTIRAIEIVKENIDIIEDIKIDTSCQIGLDIFTFLKKYLSIGKYNHIEILDYKVLGFSA